MIDNNTSNTTMLLERLQYQIKAVVGEDANITFPESGFYVNNFNLQTAKQNYQSLINTDIDIIIAFGVITSEVISHKSSTKHLRFYLAQLIKTIII